MAMRAVGHARHLAHSLARPTSNSIIQSRLATLMLKSTHPLTRTMSTGGEIQPFKLADIGEGIAEVELMKWFVKEGDSVKAFDRICEVQSDKATVEITSRYDGVIMRVLHEEGSIVKVGSSLVDIKVEADPQGDKVSNSPEPALLGGSTPVASPAFSRDSAIPQRNDSRVMTTPAVRKLAKENHIDLSAVAATGPKGRVVKEDILAHLNSSHHKGSRTGTASPKSTFVSKAPQSPRAEAPTQPSPPSSSSSSSSSSLLSTTPIKNAKNASDRVVPIRGVQRLMVKSMTAALQVQHLTYSDELTIDELVSLRGDLKAEGKRLGVKVSIMPIIIKATSLALHQFPMLNATVNADCSEMTYHGNHNIGIAMDTSKGLVVPVLRSVQNKTIFEIAKELNELQKLALEGRLTEAHLSGGTFTLSNIGSIGGTYVVPVLVVPQVAIAAIGKHQIVPRYFNKHGGATKRDDIYSGDAVVKPATVMNVSWSADHRVVDGATVAKFSNLWKSFLERPSTMLGNLQ